MAQLRDYQRRSCEMLRGHYAAGHSRATLVLPCGTGKTLVAIQEIPTSAGARTVMFVPTLALLHQTWITLRTELPDVTLLGVCGAAAAALDDDLSTDRVADLLHTDLTTDPEVYAARLRDITGPTITLATYASSGVIAAAGITFDLVICDEAHRTAGPADKAWAAPVHTVAAHRRLFVTATPRTIALASQVSDLDDVDVISMASLSDYGPHVAPIGLRQAITDGYLADYSIAVIGVTNREAMDQLNASKTTTGHRPEDAAGQQALLNAAQTYGLRSVLVFHNRRADSRRWITQLEIIAAERGIPLYSKHIEGGSEPAERAEALTALADPGDRLTVISNCRVLSEGVDVPALDAVMFAAPRTGGPDIVQIVGRALRPHPGGRHRKALVIVPVLDYTDDDADLDAKAARTSYLAAWQVLAALAAEDELLHRSLARWAGGGGGEEPGDDHADETLFRLDIDTLSRTAREFVLKAVGRAASPHLITAARLRAFYAEYGHANPAGDTITPDGFRLGERVRAARVAHRASRLHPRIVGEFEAIPTFAWTIRGSGERRSPDYWIKLIEHYVTETGIHALPKHQFVFDPHSGLRVGIGGWFHGPARKRGYLTAEEKARLAATGVRPC